MSETNVQLTEGSFRAWHVLFGLWSSLFRWFMKLLYRWFDQISVLYLLTHFAGFETYNVYARNSYKIVTMAWNFSQGVGVKLPSLGRWNKLQNLLNNLLKSLTPTYPKGGKGSQFCSNVWIGHNAWNVTVVLSLRKKGMMARCQYWLM